MCTVLGDVGPVRAHPEVSRGMTLGIAPHSSGSSGDNEGCCLVVRLMLPPVLSDGFVVADVLYTLDSMICF